MDTTTELTRVETNRQDLVDNAIYALLNQLGIKDGGAVETMNGEAEPVLAWDVAELANVRETIQEIVVGKHGLMTEAEFYPFRDENEEEQA